MGGSGRSGSAPGSHDQDWQRLSMSEGTKGPRLFDWACVPMLHQWEEDGRHWLLMRRSLTDPREKAYYFVFGPPGTTLQEMVKAIGARWHIEEVFQTAKDLGLDQDAGAQLRWMVSPLFGIGLTSHLNTSERSLYCFIILFL